MLSKLLEVNESSPQAGGLKHTRPTKIIFITTVILEQQVVQHKFDKVDLSLIQGGTNTKLKLG